MNSANIFITMGIALGIIGLLLWKKVIFEIEGDDYETFYSRELHTKWVGENLTWLGSIITILGLLYKFSEWFNVIKTMFFLCLVVLVVCIRYCSKEEFLTKKEDLRL